jgi:hypothetical protein
MISGSPQQTALGELLRELKASTGLTLKELTVLAEDNDPYRLDTPACHRKAAWFRDQMLDRDPRP